MLDVVDDSLVVEVLSKLDRVQDILCLASTCKRLHGIIAGDDFAWKCVAEAWYPVSVNADCGRLTEEKYGKNVHRYWWLEDTWNNSNVDLTPRVRAEGIGFGGRSKSGQEEGYASYRELVLDGNRKFSSMTYSREEKYIMSVYRFAAPGERSVECMLDGVTIVQCGSNSIDVHVTVTIQGFDVLPQLPQVYTGGDGFISNLSLMKPCSKLDKGLREFSEIRQEIDRLKLEARQLAEATACAELNEENASMKRRLSVVQERIRRCTADFEDSMSRYRFRDIVYVSPSTRFVKLDEHQEGSLRIVRGTFRYECMKEMNQWTTSSNIPLDFVFCFGSFAYSPWIDRRTYVPAKICTIEKHGLLDESLCLRPCLLPNS
eukprot:jgi/Picsp_1/6721/NSC_04062-R2_---NA---